MSYSLPKTREVCVIQRKWIDKGSAFLYTVFQWRACAREEPLPFIGGGISHKMARARQRRINRTEVCEMRLRNAIAAKLVFTCRRRGYSA